MLGILLRSLPHRQLLAERGQRLFGPPHAAQAAGEVPERHHRLVVSVTEQRPADPQGLAVYGQRLSVKALQRIQASSDVGEQPVPSVVNSG